ncbi:MAG: hypothetical protein AABX08_02495 [Nanoarchaeota archaeon]
MDKIFEVIDKAGRKIRLTKKQWSHVRQDHPEVEEDEIKKVLQKPLKIVDKGKNKFFYYQYFKNKKPPAKYLRVIVNYLNGEGFIITAYFVRNIS